MKIQCILHVYVYYSMQYMHIVFFQNQKYEQSCCYKVQIDLKKIECIDVEDVNGFCERIDHLYNIRYFTGVLLSRFILNASSLIHQ